MCKSCVETIQRLFPDVPPKEYGEFLMKTTAFPAGTPEYIKMQLEHIHAAGYTTQKTAENYSLEQFDREMERFNVENRDSNS